MNTENQLQERLDALNKMNLDELRDLCRKYYPGAKNCRSKMLLRKKISFMLQHPHWRFTKYFEQQIKKIYFLRLRFA